MDSTAGLDRRTALIPPGQIRVLVPQKEESRKLLQYMIGRHTQRRHDERLGTLL